MKKNPKSLSIGFCYDDSLDKSDGVSQYVRNVGAWLSRQGHEVVYLVGETKLQKWDNGPVYSLSKNLKVNFNGNRVSTPLPASGKKISRALMKHDLDVLHVQMPYSPFMAGRVIKRAGPRTAVVGTFHIYPAGPAAAIGSRFLRLTYLRTLPRFIQVMSVSKAAARFAQNTFGINSTVSSNVVNLLTYRQAVSIPRQNHIVFLGRLVKRKGCAELLAAFKLLRKTLPDATLTIAGDGPERRKLEKFVRENNLEDCVTFLGFVDEEAKPDLLASAAIACFPSTRGESFGIVLIEAMAAGAGAVLGGNNPGYAVVLGGCPQALFDPLDISSFAKKLETYLTNRALILKLHSCQERQVEKYDIEVVGPQLIAVYNAAIAKRRALLP